MKQTQADNFVPFFFLLALAATVLYAGFGLLMYRVLSA